MMLHFKRRLAQSVKIDMTPIIDCVFLLLIFFMITSSIIKDPGIPVNLPAARSSDSQPDKDLVVTVKDDGSVYLNDKPIRKADLYVTLQTLRKQKGRDFLIVRGDKVIQYGVLVEIMDIARLAGIASVTLATKK